MTTTATEFERRPTASDDNGYPPFRSKRELIEYLDRRGGNLNVPDVCVRIAHSDAHLWADAPARKVTS